MAQEHKENKPLDDLTQEEHEFWADEFMEKMAHPKPKEIAFFAERCRMGLGVGLDEKGKFVHGSDK